MLLLMQGSFFSCCFSSLSFMNDELRLNRGTSFTLAQQSSRVINQINIRGCEMSVQVIKLGSFYDETLLPETLSHQGLSFCIRPSQKTQI